MLKALSISVLLGPLSCGHVPPNQNNYHSSHDGAATCFVAAMQPSANTEGTNQHEPNAEDKLIHWLSSLVDVRSTDILIVIFTGVLAVKTSGLHKETAALREIADQQRTDLASSVEVARDSARAAQKSADVAEKALIDLERPYLFLGLVVPHYSYVSPAGTPLEVQYKIDSFGRTPATISHIMIKTFISTTIEPDIGTASPFRLDGAMHVARGESRQMPTIPIGFIKSDIWREIMGNNKSLFFTGQIFSSDIFGNSYEDGFAVRTALPAGQGRLGFTAEGCGKYNYKKKIWEGKANLPFFRSLPAPKRKPVDNIAEGNNTDVLSGQARDNRLDELRCRLRWSHKLTHERRSVTRELASSLFGYIFVMVLCALQELAECFGAPTNIVHPKNPPPPGPTGSQPRSTAGYLYFTNGPDVYLSALEIQLLYYSSFRRSSIKLFSVDLRCLLD